MRLLLNFLFCLTLAGCYEGWDYDRAGVPGGEPPEPPATKPISYILFQPIYPTHAAVQAGLCGVDINYLEYRSNEWKERVAAIAKALNGIADTVVQAEITVSDCSTMTTVDVASLDLAPWGSEPEPQQDPANRAEIELKAAFWDGDVALTPGGVVRTLDWLAWRDLINGGRNAKSLQYFLLSNNTNGYFGAWRTEMDLQTMSPEPIDLPNPVGGGIAERAAKIAADTESLVQWVLSEAAQ